MASARSNGSRSREESVDAAFASASETAGADRVAVAFDGFLTVEGARADAVYVEALDCQTGAHIVLAQRYQPKRLLSKFRTLGDPAALDAETNGRLRSG